MILTISIGRKEYADAACTLAASASLSGLPCSVITDGNISGREHLFEHIIHTDEKNPFRLKTLLHRLTPYEKTLYVDADSLIIPGSDLKKRIEGLSGSVFAAHQYARLSPGSHGAGRYHWASVADIFSFHSLKNPISAFQSSVMYFERAAGSLFEAANHAYGSMLCRRTRDGYFPDELAFSIATSKTMIYPQPLFNVGFCGNLVNISDCKKAVILTKAGNEGRIPVRKFYRALAESMIR